MAHAVSASVSETAGYFMMFKNNDAPGGKRMFLDYIRLICGTVPASATAGHFFLKLDTVNRYTSGGSVIVPQNVNADKPNQSVVQMWAGALTTPAAGASARVVGRGVLRSILPLANDEWILKSGTIEAAAAAGLALATAGRFVVPVSPIVLGPQQWLGLQLWWPSNASTAGQYEFEAGWWER